MLNVTNTIRLCAHFRHNGTVFNCLIMEHKDYQYFLPSGSKDTIHAFTLEGEIYVLSINKPIGYIGMNRYMASEPNPINSIFLQDEQEIQETLGVNWRRMKPLTIARKLFNYLYI